MNTKEPLNERLKTLRKENGYIQQQVAGYILGIIDEPRKIFPNRR